MNTKIKSMEEKLSEEWGLNTAEDIRDKIFENYTDNSSLTDILEAEKLVACSYALGKILASYKVGLKTAQLRRFYESLINIRAITGATGDSRDVKKLRHEIVMLKPQLANAKARQQREVTPFFDVINPMLDIVKDAEDYEILCKFVEAIVAYHKYCGGRD